MTIVPIAEGHGEESAFPIVIRRYLGIRNPAVAIRVQRPIRVTRSTLVRPGELERAIRLAKIKEPDCVPFVLIDADNDCPAALGAALLERARRIDPNTAVVLAKSEFEAWFIAAIKSLCGAHGLHDDIAPPQDPENILGAKEWLSDHSPTVDQPSFAATFDLSVARANSPSFDKCLREFDRLFTLLEMRQIVLN
jgi:hypothetical protein